MPQNTQEESYIRIGKKTFLTALIILGVLMLAVGVLTQVVPTGSYERVVSGGHETVVEGTFRFTQAARLPVWRWFTAPVEVLFSSDGAVVAVIILFLLAVSIAFAMLEKSGVVARALSAVVRRFRASKYRLLAVVVFFFMAMGAVLGTFEENIALVPIVVALSYCMGWDALVGLGMSMLASCFGFTAALLNPFSVVITQRIAELPPYSGFLYRLVIFLVYYALIYLFLYRYARRVEKSPERSLVFGDDAALRAKYRDADAAGALMRDQSPEAAQKLRRATRVFVGFLFLMLALIFAASFVSALSDLILPIIGVLLLAGGAVCARIVGVPFKERLRIAKNGALGIAPGVVLILMAMSVKFIIYNGGIMDTILYYTAGVIAPASPYVAVLLIYALVLVLELFVASSSAKAFLVMPLIAPLCDLVGVTRQTAVLAFCFGDGFSNIIYPTNPVLLICLGLTVVTYPRWFKWTYKLQLAAFALACLFLVVGVAMGYGPF